MRGDRLENRERGRARAARIRGHEHHRVADALDDAATGTDDRVGRVAFEVAERARERLSRQRQSHPCRLDEIDKADGDVDQGLGSSPAKRPVIAYSKCNLNKMSSTGGTLRSAVVASAPARASSAGLAPPSRNDACRLLAKVAMAASASPAVAAPSTLVNCNTASSPSTAGSEDERAHDLGFARAAYGFVTAVGQARGQAYLSHERLVAAGHRRDLRDGDPFLVSEQHAARREGEQPALVGRDLLVGEPDGLQVRDQLEALLGIGAIGHSRRIRPDLVRGDSPMLLIFGMRNRVHRHGPCVAATCPRCHNEVVLEYAVVTRWFTLFFIPVIPFGRRRVLVCPICSWQREVPVKSEPLALEMIGITASWKAQQLDDAEYSRRVDAFWSFTSHDPAHAPDPPAPPPPPG